MTAPAVNKVTLHYPRRSVIELAAGTLVSYNPRERHKIVCSVHSLRVKYNNMQLLSLLTQAALSVSVYAMHVYEFGTLRYVRCSLTPVSKHSRN